MMGALTSAGTGWSKILGGKPDWQDNFRFDAEGANAGFIAYGVAVLIAIVLASLRIGFPPPDVVLLLIAGHVMPLLTLVLVTAAAVRLAGAQGASARFLVPGLYLIALMKLIEGVAVLAGINLAGAILAVTAILAFRLARANGLALGWSIGYGIAFFVLLAGLPIALYMLVSAT